MNRVQLSTISIHNSNFNSHSSLFLRLLSYFRFSKKMSDLFVLIQLLTLFTFKYVFLWKSIFFSCFIDSIRDFLNISWCSNIIFNHCTRCDSNSWSLKIEIFTHILFFELSYIIESRELLRQSLFSFELSKNSLFAIIKLFSTYQIWAQNQWSQWTFVQFSITKFFNNFFFFSWMFLIFSLKNLQRVYNVFFRANYSSCLNLFAEVKSLSCWRTFFKHNARWLRCMLQIEFEFVWI